MNNKYLSSIFQMDCQFLNGFLSYCYENCQKLLLDFKNVQHSELYINSVLGFVFNKNSNSIQNGREFRSLIPEFEKYVKKYNYKDSDSDTENIFFDNLKFIEQNNEPIIVNIDTYYLEYATNYMKNHSSHCAILCGYDLYKKVVYIIDWYYPWFFKGEIPIQNFLQARSSKNINDGTLYSGKKINNSWTYIGNIPQFSYKDLVKYILTTTYEINCCMSNKSGIFSYGIDAFETLEKYVTNISDYNELERLYKNIQLYIPRYNLFLETLKAYKKYDKNFDLSNFIYLISQINQNWDLLAKYILKKGLVQDQEFVINKISESFIILKKNHNLLFDKIHNILKQPM